MNYYCEYCNQPHSKTSICPPNRRDSIHCNKELKDESKWRQPLYGQRLQDGFYMLHEEDEYITDKFGNIRGSGNY